MEKKLTNGEVIDTATNAGPLSKEEALRRAKIMVYNDLVETYGGKLTTLQVFPNMHPETRQIIALAAEFVNDLASEILVDLSADERAKKENK